MALSVLIREEASPPSLPGHTLPNALLTDVQFGAHQDLWGRLFPAAWTVLVPAVIPSQGQNFAILFVELPEIPVS